MKWICNNCGRKNDQIDPLCTKCGIDQETAMTMAVVKRRRTCEDCGHKHHEGVYCHVYTEAGDEDMDDPDMIDEEEQEEEDIDDDFDFAPKTKSVNPLAKPKGKAPPMRPLLTPAFAKVAGFVRCNCNVGIPNDSLKYEPLPRSVYNGKIQIQTYFEINDPFERAKFEEALKAKYHSPEAVAKKRQEDLVEFSQRLPIVLSFLPYGYCSPIPKVCSLWNYGTNMYKEYIDIRNCVPWQVSPIMVLDRLITDVFIQCYRPHAKQVESVLIHADKLYSGGDHRVLVSDVQSGEILSTVTRDSGEITKLAYKDGEIFVCSSNGSVRTYALTHTGKNIQLTSTMWDHTRSITDLMASIPSVGPCLAHSIENHICYLYTSSEDRTAKMWNTSRLQLVRTVYSNALRSCTFTKLTQSDRHLFVGTTTASIAVFSKYNFCEREDIHLCHLPNADKAYCLQVTLKLPNNKLDSGNLPWVTGLLCPPFGPEFPTLWASDAVGNITIWYIPKTGLEFTPAYTTKAHQGPITQLSNTWRHVVSIGDDGNLILHDIISFARIRTINIMEWSIYKEILPNPHIHRKLKSIHVQENYDTGGQMVVGTSYGDVIFLSLGTTV